jgi:hypothetical protein
LAPALEAEPAVLGVLGLSWGVVQLLDRIWKALDAAGSGAAWRWGLLLLGPLIGAATALSIATHSRWAAMASAAVIAAGLGALVVLWAVKAWLRRSSPR